MTIQLSKLLSTGEFGQFLTNRHTVLTVCRHNGYRTELGEGSTIIWRESGTIDHMHGDHHAGDVSALRLVRRVPNLRRQAIGATLWTLGGYRARIESKQRPDSEHPVWSCALYRPDGSWHSTMNYTRYGLPVNMQDGETEFDLVWRNEDVDPELQLRAHTIDIHSNPAHKVSTPLVVGAGGHGVAATLGHLASNGGLRGHSVGDVFPYIPFFKGPNFEEWVRCPDGTEEGPFTSRDAMIRFIDMHHLTKEQEALPEFHPTVVLLDSRTNEVITTVDQDDAPMVLSLLQHTDPENAVVVCDMDGNSHTFQEYLDILEQSNKLLGE